MTSRRAGTPASPRDLPLEALRGLAALVVGVWHFLLAFHPAILGDPGYGFRGNPLFAFMHGSAAIGIFFVLSGYVLTRRYFETGQKRVLVIGALKRWFRLFLPVFLSVMLGWLLFHFHLYSYEEAGRMSHSNWLASFGFAMKPPFDPAFPAALKEGFTEAFAHNNNSFNPLLWTIHIELMGSYAAFAFAALIKNLRGGAGPVAMATLLACFSLHFVEPFLTAFLLGTLLAFYTPRLKVMKSITAYALIAVGLIFLGYREPIGFYGFLAFLDPINGETLRAYICTAGAVLIMMSFIGCEPLRRKLQGRAARILGRLSFPFYLVQIILIASLGSAVFIRAQDGHSYGAPVAITALVLLPATIALATVFAVIDIKWIAFVNGVFRKMRIAP